MKHCIDGTDASTGDSNAPQPPPSDGTVTLYGYPRIFGRAISFDSGAWIFADGKLSTFL